MQKRLVVALATLAALSVVLAPSAAGARAPSGAGGVFIQSNDPTGNEIVAYRRSADGTLDEMAAYPTHGLGGIAEGAASDPLASQGGLVYSAAEHTLIAVNAGSDTISAFDVKGLRLRFLGQVDSGGEFPVSLTIHGDLVFVLNAGGEGTISGFRITSGGLVPLTDSTRTLGLANTTPPNFLMSPAQIGFTPNGKRLIVTTKGSGTIEVFAIRKDGLPSADSVSTSDPNGPFAFLFDGDRLLVTDAFISAVTAYRFGSGGSLNVVDGPVTNGQAATCWIVEASGHLVVSNTGSNTLSSYRASGALTLEQAVASTTDAGPIDMAVTPDGATVFLQNGVDQTIQAFAVQSDGSLDLLATTDGPPQANGVPFEGIVVI
jgi:DNA-binding beta-propeller fold protein YncE